MPLPIRSLAAALVLAVGGLVAACDPMPVGPADAAADGHPVTPPTDGGFDAGHDPLPDAGRDGGLDPSLYEDVCGPIDSWCLGRLCVTSIHNPTFADCCDSAYCNCDPVDHEWETWFCDPPPPPDAGVDAGGP